ncbi:hypothetical protein [Nocardia asiatica]|uniref:hypothetical protein n=1 Tax=Nocardia asiatica TaxID=209252 RepID=UPI0005C24D6D|nr:hypothetical protein [Nocardia asiatica]
MHSASQTAVGRIKLWPYATHVAAGGIDHTQFDLDRLTFDIFAASFRIDTPEKAQALLDSYQWAKTYLAPFVVKLVIDMAPALLNAVARNPRAKIVFLGRDGFVFGYALSILLPKFYAAHCTTMYLSRSLVNAALRELEEYEGKSFAGIREFRKRAAAESDPRGAWRRLTAYFIDQGIDIGAEGSEIHVVDTGLKGSIQEMLAAAYPQTRFFGHYAFYAESPADPHPRSKKGYALHLDVEHGSDGNAIRDGLPTDPGQTFLHHQAIVAVEGAVQGSHLSPSSYGLNGKPLLTRQRHDASNLSGARLSLVDIQPADPQLREGIRSITVVGICQHARTLLLHASAAGPSWITGAQTSRWYVDLIHRTDELRNQMWTHMNCCEA